MKHEELQQIVRLALGEDLGSGDVTTKLVIPKDLNLEGDFVAKASGVVAGLEVACAVFEVLDPGVTFQKILKDGDAVHKGQKIAVVKGTGRALLSGERLALNFLQRMSGIATLTRSFVEAVSGTKVVILDTRKTAPGLRLLDKWAVVSGGAKNHRLGLYDQVLIKENHIHAVGGVKEAVQKVRVSGYRGLIEVEVRNLHEVHEALKARVERILLDNMDLNQIQEVVKIVAGRVPLEVSGNVNLDNVAFIAKTGVDFISVGALTHSVTALDVSFLVR